jgi:hypothetical protein
MPTILFTTPGSGSWTKPAGVTSIKVECWGGGGNGGGAPNGGGGGGGAYAQNHGYEQYPSQSIPNYPSEELTIPYYVAPGGAGNGGTLWETNISNYWVDRWNRTLAQTGQDGTPTARGLGATAVTGSITYRGGNGSRVVIGSTFSAGGGGAGSTGNGQDANVATAGGVTSEYGGNGGSSTGTAANYGGGEWGDRIGRQGLIRITFEWPSSFFTLGPNGRSQAIVSSTNGANSFVYQFPDQLIL